MNPMATHQALEHVSSRKRGNLIRRIETLRDCGMRDSVAACVALIEGGALSVIDDPPDEHAMFVLFDDRGHWVIWPSGAETYSHQFDHCEQALKRACDIAADAGSTVFMLGPDGSLVDQYEFAGQPRHLNDSALHVARITPGGWSVHRRNGGVVSEWFDSKKEALTRGRELAREEGATLVVHYATGEIQREVDYDPPEKQSTSSKK